MINNFTLAAEAAAEESSNVGIIVAVIALIFAAVLLAIYLSCCIIIVKQGTRKIVERFGTYNRTLKEGFHFIFRPFDKIVPIPWSVLSISERDIYLKNRGKHSKGQLSNDPAAQAQADAELNKMIDDLKGQIVEAIGKGFVNKINDFGEASGKKDLKGEAKEIENVDKLNKKVLNASGKTLNRVVDFIVNNSHSFDAAEKSFDEMGLDIFDSDNLELIENIREKDALAESIKYYPRHQDPRSNRPGKWPMAENHVMDYIDLRERHIDTEHIDVSSKIKYGRLNGALSSYKDLKSGLKFITKDNASVEANVVIFFSITDPYLYYYGAEEPEVSMVLLAITTLRNIISGMCLEDALQARTEINKQIRQEVDIATNNWGIKVNRVEVKEFILSKEMKEAMNKVLIAERIKRATILEAEGRAQAYTTIKEAQVTPDILKLEGYKTLQSISDGKANKVFIPNDLSEFITGAHVVADAFKDAKTQDESDKKEDK